MIKANTITWDGCSPRGLTPTVAVLCGMLLAVGSTTLHGESKTQSAELQFALIGDMPYDARQKKEFANVMNEINASHVAFVVHDGDFWGDGIAWKDKTKGLPPCSDETFQDRLSLAQSSRHPFIFVPGDNDWTDCHRAKPRAYDPLERLAKLRQMFSSGNQSLGRHTMRLTRQSENTQYARFRENVRWTFGDVLFVTLHMVGSNNNLGRTPDMDAEYAERNAANLAWMRQAFELAKRGGSKAVMIIAQANPRLENTWPPSAQKRYMQAGLGFEPPKTRKVTGFDEFLAALAKETLGACRT